MDLKARHQALRDRLCQRPMLVYPADWAEIRERVMQRAAGTCEVCGLQESTPEQPNYVTHVEGELRRVPADRLAKAQAMGFAVFGVILSVVARNWRLRTWWTETNLLAACTECVITMAYEGAAAISRPDASGEQQVVLL